MGLSAEQQSELQAQLLYSIEACNDRCQYFAAKWSTELLNSLPLSEEPAGVNSSFDTEIIDDDDDDAEIEDLKRAMQPSIPPKQDRKDVKLELRERPLFLLAKSFFDCKEYDRCAAVFLPDPTPHDAPSYQVPGPTKLQTTPSSKRYSTTTGLKPSANSQSRPRAPPKSLSQKSLFLALYARYLAGEKRKNEDAEVILGPHDGPATANKEIPGILAVLEEWFNERGGLQNMQNSSGWLDYLYGIVLARARSEPLAKQCLLRSVKLYPFNWSAWLELGALIGSVEELQQLNQHLPQSVMAYFFHLHCNQELFQQDPHVYTSLDQMLNIFPRSAFLQQQKALLLHHARDHDQAMSLFDSLLRNHPHRLDGMEIYSNLLYVLPSRPKLASLAAIASETDKFRPETNCILGNYYSLISEHEKAVLHFRRALTLDRNFQAAWTLMGHEYIELKNTQAAIESYRRAVDTNRKDYRAWYGLGQGYEMLECYSYSLFYYQRAAALFPGDPKMWAAVGNAYAKCNKIANAIQAYKRALVVSAQSDQPAGSFSSSTLSDPLAQAVGGALDPQILYDVALLYERDGNWIEAAAYMELTLAQEEGPEDGGTGQDGNEGTGVTIITSRARLWLARWSYSCGDWQRTMDLANELCQDGVEVEEAKSLVRDVRSRLGGLSEAGEEAGEEEPEGEDDDVGDDEGDYDEEV